MSWPMPEGVSGNPALIRLSGSLLDRGSGSCAEFTALKARPKVVPDAWKRRYAPWEAFPLGIVSQIVDMVEFDGVGAEDAIGQVIRSSRTSIHPGVVSWVHHAALTYLTVDAQLAAALAAEGIELRPQSRPRVIQHAVGGSVRMLTAWGRWYSSGDGTVREFRRLRYRRPRGTAADASTVALAYVTASGALAAGNPNYDIPVAMLPSPGAPPERVRVVEVGLTDGIGKVILDAHPEEIHRRYTDKVRPIAAQMLDGGNRVASSDCAECKISTSCDALPRVDGLLGLSDRGTHRRTWSVRTGRYYQICPAQAHLRDLHLPGDDNGTDAVRRGVAVHDWMSVAHSRPGHRPCSAADLPEPGSGELGIAAQIMDEPEYRGLRPYLAQHLAVCPLARPGDITEVAPEQTVAVFDTTADVIVIAKPDLLLRAKGQLVYREMKTSAVPRDITKDNALSLVPQLALAVCMIADGVLGDRSTTTSGHTAGYAELELLTPDSAEVITFDTADVGVVTTARQVLTRLTSTWHQDTRFQAVPGPWCAGCPVARWCPDAASPAAPVIVIDGVSIDARTGEVLSAKVGLSTRAEAVTEMICEPQADDELGI